MDGRTPLPKGWVRDKNNPGLIKLSGQEAQKENLKTNEIIKLNQRIDHLENEIGSLKRFILDKLNK